MMDILRVQLHPHHYLVLNFGARKMLYNLSKEMAMLHLMTLLRTASAFSIFEQVSNTMRLREL